MANIRVTPAPELLVLQQRLATALAPYGTTGDAAAFLPEEDGAINEATVAYVRDFVAKASGNNYKPHVTVGIGNQAAVRRLVAGPFEPLRFKAQAVSVYQLGNYCTARKRLWSTAAKLP